MEKIAKKLLLTYIILVIAKSILVYLVPAPSAFSDGYIYAKLARSFFYDLEFTVHGLIYYHYLPLYSILLSPAFVFGKMAIIYPFMKIINSIISSLIIFPAFYLAKELLTEKRAIYTTVIISLLPSNFIFSSYVLAENVFYPLFLFSLYFIYKAFISGKFAWSTLAGIFIGVTCLSKISGVVLFPVVVTTFLYKFIKKESGYFKHLLLIFLIALLIISPWTIRNYLINGNLFGGYAEEASTIFDLNSFILKFIVQFIIYSGLLIMSAGVFLPMLISKKIFAQRFIVFSIIAISAIFFTLLIASNHNVQLTPSGVSFDIPGSYIPWLAGRIIGRYIDVILPLVILLGAICIDQKISLKKTILFSGILFFSSQAVLSVLLPINNVSVSYLGLLNLFLESFVKFPINILIIAALLGAIPFILYKTDFNFKKACTLLMAFLVLVNIINFSMIYYNSDTFWYKGEQMQLGIWLDSYDQKFSTFLFDKRDCTSRILKLDQTSICEPDGWATIIGFWLNDKIIIGEPNNLKDVDFVISRHDIQYLRRIQSTESGINVYSTKEIEK